METMNHTTDIASSLVGYRPARFAPWSLDENKSLVPLMEATRRFMSGRNPRTGRIMHPQEHAYRRFMIESGREDYATFCGIREAVGTADLATLQGNVIDREFLTRYATYNSGMRQLCNPRPVDDFRLVDVLDVEYLRSPLQLANENQPVKDDNGISTTQVQWRLDVYEKAFGISWQSLVNDNMGVFGRIPQLMLEAAIATENRLVTSTYVNSSGPISGAFTSVGTAAYSIAALQAAFAILAQQTITTANGTVPIMALPKFLVTGNYSTFLQMQADVASPNVVYAVIKDTPKAYSTANTVNGLNLQVVYDPWVPIIDTTSGTTDWFLFAGPDTQAALEFGTYRPFGGAPMVYMQAQDKQTVGGGMANAMEGSFATNSLRYKVVHPMQCKAIMSKAAYASSGTK